MNDQLQVECGPADDNGRRLVIAILGERSHRDYINTDLEFSREKFRSAVISKFGLPDDAHEHIESAIIASADEQDERPTSLWKADSVSIAEVETKSTEWLWQDYFPAGAIVVIDGDPGLGKSQLSVDLAARLSRGDAMPPITAPDNTYAPAGTLIVNGEDDPARTLRPRLDAAGANVERVYLLRSMTLADGADQRAVMLPRDLPEVEQLIIDRGIRLAVFDPFVAFLDSTLSMNNDADVRRCLSEVATMAERTGCCVLLVRHLNKKSGLAVQYRGGGSIGITGAARAVFVVGVDPDDSDSRILAPVKNNLAPEPPALRFGIESIGNTSRIAWDDAACHVSAGDLVAKPRTGSGSKLEAAKAIIAEILGNGPRGSNEVEQACLGAGVSKSTYHRARQELGVLSEKTGFDDGQWLMTLPSRNGEFHA